MKRAAVPWLVQWWPRPSCFPPAAAPCSRAAGQQDPPARPGARRWPSGSAAPALAVGVGAASAREIDRLNIRVATALAMRRAIAAASLTRVPASPRRPYRILIDGLPLPEIGYAHEALVDGDAHCQSHRGRGHPRQDRARPPDAAARRAAPRLRLGDQRGLRHRGAPGRAPAAGPHPASPPHLRAARAADPVLF